MRTTNGTINAAKTVSDNDALAAWAARINYEQLREGYWLCYKKMPSRDIVSNAKAAATVDVSPAAFAAALNCLVTFGEVDEVEQLLYDDEVNAALSDSDALRSALIDVLYRESPSEGPSYLRAYGMALEYRAVACKKGTTRIAFESYLSMKIPIGEIKGENPGFTELVHAIFWTFATGRPNYYA